MGDPRKIRKKYQKPNHPWQKDRIVEELKLKKEYSLSNKKEIWKFDTLLKKYKDQAKKLIAMQGEQADKERKEMMDKLKSYGLISPDNETYDTIFSLQLKDVLERMLSTILFKKGLARSTKQARQFIVHGHVMIGDKKLSSPTYLVPIKQESMINFSVSSSLYSENHPERVDSESKKDVQKEVKKITKTSEKKKDTPKVVKKDNDTKEKDDTKDESKQNKVESKKEDNKKPKHNDKKEETPTQEVKKDKPNDKKEVKEEKVESKEKDEKNKTEEKK